MLIAALAVSSFAANAPALTSATHDDPAFAALDASLNQLSAQATDGPHIGGFIRTRFAFSNDVDTDPGANEKDLAGFNLDNVRVSLTGDAGSGFSYVVSLEAGQQLGFDTFTSSGVGLYDGYVDIAINDWAKVRVGQFCAKFMTSCCFDERNLLFLDRSFLDEIWDNRDLGAEFAGDWDIIHARVAAQNGFDSQGDDLAVTLRAGVDVLGHPNPLREGGLGHTDETELALGIAYFDDNTFDEGTMLGGDVWFRRGPWSATAEIIDFGDDMKPGNVINTSTGEIIPGAGTSFSETAWNLMGAYLFAGEQWEVAARFQDQDDDADTTIISACVNRYVAGHDIKWTLQVDSASSDDDTLEADALAVGLTVGF